jgi:hypothetical protein
MLIFDLLLLMRYVKFRQPLGITQMTILASLGGLTLPCNSILFLTQISWIKLPSKYVPPFPLQTCFCSSFCAKSIPVQSYERSLSEDANGNVKKFEITISSKKDVTKFASTKLEKNTFLTISLTFQ